MEKITKFPNKKVLIILFAAVFVILVIYLIWKDEIGFMLLGDRRGQTCGEPKLAIGSSVFLIEETMDLSQVNDEETAYLMKRDENGYIFSLSPSIENMELVRLLRSGDIATITGADCQGFSFSLQAPRLEKDFPQDQFNQTANDFTLWVNDKASDTFIIVTGEIIEAEFIYTIKPNLESREQPSEITLIDVKFNEMQEVIKITISIRNSDDSILKISTEDIYLISPDQTMILPVEFKPSLPLSVSAGEKEKIEVVFENVPAALYEFRVFSTEFLLEQE